MVPRWTRWLVAVATACTLTACGGADRPPAPVPDASRLTFARAVHRATTLPDGQVLLTGGCTTRGCGGFDEGRISVLLSASGRSSAGARMSQPRAAHTATLLADGRVLVVGGYPGEGRPPTATAEVYDAATGRFTETGPLHAGRADHSATLLADGRVLVAGGFGDDGAALDTTEVYDPETGSFVAGPRLSSPRADHVAVRDGDRVVLVGGTVDGPALDTTDVLAGDAWTAGPRLGTGRVKHAVVVLPGHRLLVVGGATDVEGRTRLDSTEVLAEDADRGRPGPRLSEPEYKLDGAVATLADGRVVIAGGRRVDVYDPGRDTMRVLASPVLPRLSFRTANVVGPTTVLLAGGYDDAIVPTDQLVQVTVPAE